MTWYGFPPLEYIDATKIRASLMGHFATEDAFFPIAQVDALEEKLKAAGKPVHLSPVSRAARVRQRDHQGSTDSHQIRPVGRRNRLAAHAELLRATSRRAATDLNGHLPIQRA